MTTRIKLRRDTATNWGNANPILALGEAGYDTTNNEIRVGDGTSTWTSLSPIGGGLPTGMIATTWEGGPNLNNDTTNSDADYMQFQTQTDWTGNSTYGRATLSWHDLNNSLYSHVHADPYGVSIRTAAWGPGGYENYWEFLTYDGEAYTRFPNGLIFDTWDGQAEMSNDWIKLYEGGDVSGESSGQYDAYSVQMQAITAWDNNDDYGRATLSWHEWDYSRYSHVHVDPYGAAIRLASWNNSKTANTQGDGSPAGEYQIEWAFNNNGSTEFPGAIVNATVTQTTSAGNTIEIDLTKTINKLTPTGGSSTSNGVYHLADGTEGQIMHLVPQGNVSVSNEYTGINIDNCRYRSGNTFSEGSGNYWLPFFDHAGSTGTTIVTLIFTDGHWNLPHNSFD